MSPSQSVSVIWSGIKNDFVSFFCTFQLSTAACIVRVYSATFAIGISLAIHPRLWRTLAFTRVLLLVFPDFVVMMTTPLLAREP